MTDQELAQFGEEVLSRMDGAEPVASIVADILARVDELRPVDHATWINNILVKGPKTETRESSRRKTEACAALLGDVKFKAMHESSIREGLVRDPSMAERWHAPDEVRALGDRVVDQLRGEEPVARIAALLVAEIPRLETEHLRALLVQISQGTPALSGPAVGQAQLDYDKRLEEVNILLIQAPEFHAAMKRMCQERENTPLPSSDEAVDQLVRLLSEGKSNEAMRLVSDTMAALRDADGENHCIDFPTRALALLNDSTTCARVVAERGQKFIDRMQKVIKRSAKNQ